MDKRTFIQSLGMGAAALALSRQGLGKGNVMPHAKMPMIRPPLLKRGDTVGIITPSSPAVNEEAYTNATENFKALGLRVKWGKHVRKRYGYLAGRDEERLDDLHNMFADPDVRAIVCLRGGSGAARLLDRLDYGLIARNPKIFLGYSDITAFHQAIFTQTGLVTFHGAVANSVWTPWVLDQFEQLFFEGNSPVYGNLDVATNNILSDSLKASIRIINPGVAEGRLFGGNLTVLTAIAGSKYFPDFTDSVLFLEDIGEEPYRIDRMFSQLALSGALSKITGFIFGKCTDCEPSAGYERSLSLEQILNEYIVPLDIPAYQGALIGHIDEQYMVPIGARARIDASTGSFTVVENIFSSV